jgi:hypothetical protein
LAVSRVVCPVSAHRLGRASTGRDRRDGCPRHHLAVAARSSRPQSCVARPHRPDAGAALYVSRPDIGREFGVDAVLADGAAVLSARGAGLASSMRSSPELSPDSPSSASTGPFI